MILSKLKLQVKNESLDKIYPFNKSSLRGTVRKDHEMSIADSQVNKKKVNKKENSTKEIYTKETTTEKKQIDTKENKKNEEEEVWIKVKRSQLKDYKQSTYDDRKEGETIEEFKERIKDD